MSRTSIRGFGLFIMGQLAMLVCLLCLFAQDASAQTAPLDPTFQDQPITDWHIFNGLVVWNNDDWTYFPTYYYDHVAQEGHLRLGVFYPTGSIRVHDGRTLTFRNNHETLRNGGAIYINSGDYTFEARPLGNIGGGNLTFENNSTAGDGGAIYSVGGANLTIGGTSSNSDAYWRGGYPAGGYIAFRSLAPPFRVYYPGLPIGLDPGSGAMTAYYAPDTRTGGTGGLTKFDNWPLIFDIPSVGDDPFSLTTSVLFRGNYTTGEGTGLPVSGGGAIFNQSGSINFSNVAQNNIAGGNVRFLQNEARKSSGGAIYNDGERGPATLTFDIRSTASVSGTWTNSAGSGTSLPANHNVFEYNYAEEHGGALFNKMGTAPFSALATANLTTSDTTNNANSSHRPDFINWYDSLATSNAGFFRGNWADLSGGAIYNDRGTIGFNATTGASTATSTARGEATMGGGLAHAISSNLLNATANAGYFTGNSAGWYGGAIFHQPTIGAAPLQFNATAGVVSATANADAYSNQTGSSEAIATDVVDATSSANGGIFRYNTAGADGGAFYNRQGEVIFTANAVGANATANATAVSTPGSSSTSQAYATAQAVATTNANAAEFTQNTAGADGIGNYLGFGGAIYNERGTLRFTADAAAATSSATAASNSNNNGWAWSWANAYASAYASGADFTSNLAELGGAIYNDNGTLVLEAVAAVTANAGMTLTRSGTGDWMETESLATARSYGASFTDNRADMDGGAIYNLGGTLTFTSTAAVSTTATVTANPNSATAIFSNLWPSGVRGNGIFEDTVVEVWVGPNAYQWGRHGMATSDVAAAMFVENVALGTRNNSAGERTGRGGAMFNANVYDRNGVLTSVGTMTFNGITKFFRNVAETDGGALYNQGGILEFNANASGYSTFTRNGSNATLGINTERGGAIFNTSVYTSSGALLRAGTLTMRGGTGTGALDRYGYFLENVATEYGGAIYNDRDAILDLTNVRFLGNRTLNFDGGGIYNNEGWLTLSGGLFSYNVTGRSGGAIFFNAQDPNAPKTLILDGETHAFLFEFNDAVVSGGALYVTEHGSIDINRITFSKNAANVSGGAIYSAGFGIIANSTFEENTDVLSNGTPGIGKGGAIFNAATGTLTLTDNVFSNNRVNLSNPTGQGGALYNLGTIGTTTSTEGIHVSSGNTFLRNWALAGGAVYNAGGTITMSDSLFDRNQGQLGAAIYNAGGEIILDTVTFIQNQTYDAGSARGGAIYNEAGTLRLTDANFLNNRVQDIGGIGGAIYTENGIINLFVTNGVTAVWEDNFREYSGEWNKGINESIYFAGTSGTLTVDVDTNGLLAIYDPMRWVSGMTMNVTKTGEGEWRLAGKNEFVSGTGTINFDVQDGMFYLYRYTYDQSVPGPQPPDLVPISAELYLGSGNFRLASGATLAVDGAARVAGSVVTTGSRIVTTGGITLASNSGLTFNMSEADIERTRSGQSVLTLTGGTVSVASNVTVNAYLNGDPALGQPETWFQWFEGQGSDAGAREIFVISGAPGINLPVDGVYRWDSGINDWRRYSMERTAGSSSINDFIVENGYLKMTPTTATGWTLHWTGNTAPINPDWTALGTDTSANWYGSSGGGYTYNFYNGDHARFGDTYIDAQGAVQTVINKRVAIDNNITVGSAFVTGGGYIFDFIPGTTLSAPGGGITNGWINFGSADVNIYSGGTTTISAPGNVTFGAGGVLWFDVTNGISNGDTLLNLNAGTLTIESQTALLPAHRFQIAHTAAQLVGIADLNIGDRVTFIAAGSGQGTTINRGVFDINGIQFITARATSGVVHRFRVDGNNLNLVGEAGPTGGYNLEWTGKAGNNNWDTTSANWLGHYVGDTLQPGQLAFTFSPGDQVSFSDRYRDESGQWQNVAPSSKRIAIDVNVDVFSMNVNGSQYVFDLAANRVLSASEAIGFGSARINMESGSRISANDYIVFGTLTDTATIGAGRNTVISANTIYFNGDGDFHFDLTGAGNGALFLTLNGTVDVMSAAGAVGGGRIYVNNVDIAVGDRITLIKAGGSETVTDTGTLMRDGVAYTPQRNASGGTLLGLGTNAQQNELWLMAADAAAQAELYWTGINHASGTTNSTWSENQTNTNWSGRTTDGVHVMTFLGGDTVIFDARATNKIVNLSTSVDVESMQVRDAGYIFDLTGGGGIRADNNIDFGNGTTLVSKVGTIIASDSGSIIFGTGNTFGFDLAGATGGRTLLSLQGNINVSEAIGSGRIDVFGTIPNLVTGDYVILVNSGSANTTASTGDLYVNGALNVPRRSSNPNDTMFGLDTNSDNSQLLLRWVNANVNSDDLVWTGNQATQFASKNYYIWGEGAAYPNWNGSVSGIKVNTFLDGDTVRFDDTVADFNRRYVTINEGGVRVNSMSVTASDYIFDLRGSGIAGRSGGGIHADNFIDLNDATIVVGIRSDLTANQITAKEITLNGATVEVIDLGIDPELLRQQPGGTMDVEILVSSDAPISGTANSVLPQGTEFYTFNFFIDNTTTSGRGIVRLSYFFYENLGWNHNTREAGRALDELRFNEKYTEQFALIRSNPQDAMNQLRGTELVADSLSMALWRPWEITHQRGRNVREETGWNSWGEGYYRFGKTDSDGNADGYDMYRGGTMIGADYGANRYWQFGGALGYAIPRIDNSFGKIEADDLTLGIYSKINVFDQAWVSTFLGYGYQNYKMTRYNFGEEIQSDFNGDAWYASVEFVKPITVSILTVMPLVALDHQAAWTNSFSEPGVWGQTLAGARMDRTMVRFGVDSKMAGIGAGTARVDLATRLQAAFLVDGDKRASVVSHFPMTGASMTLKGADMGWGQLNAGISASGEFRKKYNCFLDLDAFLTNRTTALQGQIGVSTRF